MDMERAGIAVVKQNCADYFDSAGRTERYLLFGRDITTFAGAVGTAALVAAHASSGAVGGFALGTTNLIAGNDTLRKQLTYGADFTSSARTMVESNLAIFEATILAKDETKYDFLTAVSDLHDFQTICTPATIIANMNAAIATKKFNAIVVQPAGAPATTTTTTTKSVGAAPASTDQAQARQLKAQLSDLQARNLLPGSQLDTTIQQLSDSLDTLAKGQAVQHVEPAPAATPDAQHVPAQAKIILRPSDD